MQTIFGNAGKPLENLHEDETFAGDIAMQTLCNCCALKLPGMEASLKQFEDASPSFLYALPVCICEECLSYACTAATLQQTSNVPSFLGKMC